MANAKIDLQPAVCDLYLYAGDGASLRLVCRDSEEDDAAPVNMSGAISAQIRLSHLADDPPITTFSSDVTDAADGIMFLILTDTQTRGLVEDESAVNGVFKGVWDVQWTATGSTPRTLVQGAVECVTDVTR
jgi:hypothetical protein